MVRLYFPVTSSSRVLETSEQIEKKAGSRVAMLERELDAVIRKTKAAKEMNDLLVRGLQMFSFGDDAKLWQSLKDALNSLDPMSANYEESRRRLENDIQKLSIQQKDQRIKYEQAKKECEEKLNKPVATSVPGAVEHLDKMEVRRRALNAVIDAIKERGITNGDDELEALLERERDMTDVDSNFLNSIIGLANMLQYKKRDSLSPTLSEPGPSIATETVPDSTPDDSVTDLTGGLEVPGGDRHYTDFAHDYIADSGDESQPLRKGVAAHRDAETAFDEPGPSTVSEKDPCHGLNMVSCKALPNKCSYYQRWCRTHENAANRYAYKYVAANGKAADLKRKGRTSDPNMPKSPPNVSDEILIRAVEERERKVQPKWRF